MAQGAFGTLPQVMRPQAGRGKRPLTPQEEELLKQQGLTPDGTPIDSALMAGMPPVSDQMLGGAEAPAPAKGVFAPLPEQPEGKGALAGVKNKRGGATPWDYIGLAGATLGQMSGQDGAITGFMDRYKARGQDEAMTSLIDGLDLSPEEQALVAAGEGREVLAQRFADNREGKIYQRNRGDQLSDRDVMRGYQTEDRDLGYTYQDRSREDQQAFDQGQFDVTTGLTREEMRQRERQHKDTLGLGYANLRSDEAIAAAKQNANPLFDGPQLTTIYNKGNDFITEQEGMLADMETLAAESRAFQDEAKDFDSQGSSIGDSLGRFWSGITGGEVNTLNRHTKAAAALMKKPGGGAWTDADQKNAEAYVVSAENGRDANKFAANAADLKAGRQRAYVEFLRENLDPNNPTSLQEARGYWNEYAKAVPLFDPATGQPQDPNTLPSFDDWLQSSMQAEQADNDKVVQSQASDWKMFQGEFMKDPTSLRQLEAEFDQVYGAGATRKLAEQTWGKAAVPALFGN